MQACRTVYSLELKVPWLGSTYNGKPLGRISLMWGKVNNLFSTIVILIYPSSSCSLCMTLSRLWRYDFVSVLFILHSLVSLIYSLPSGIRAIKTLSRFIDQKNKSKNTVVYEDRQNNAKRPDNFCTKSYTNINVLSFFCHAIMLLKFTFKSHEQSNSLS